LIFSSSETYSGSLFSDSFFNISDSIVSLLAGSPLFSLLAGSPLFSLLAGSPLFSLLAGSPLF
jgi:hypothetical protein